MDIGEIFFYIYIKKTKRICHINCQNLIGIIIYNLSSADISLNLLKRVIIFSTENNKIFSFIPVNRDTDIFFRRPKLFQKMINYF